MFSSRDMSGEFLSSREFMGSDLFLNQTTTQQQQQNQHHHPPPQPPPPQGGGGGGGLARYRSAPSSFLAALLDSTAPENSSSGDESEAIFSALMGGQKNGGGGGGVDDQMQFHQMKQEVAVESEPRPGSMNGQMGSVVGSYSVGMDSGVDLRMNSNTSSINLLRQSSSPAGFFNGFGVMGDVGNYRVQSHAKPNSSSGNHNMNFSSGPSSSSRFMPSIPENDQLLRNRNNNNTSANNNNNNGGREFEDVNFPQDSWNHSPPFNSLKRNRDGDPKMFSNFNGFENQNGESRKNSSGLVHHLSLPKTSNEMAEVENYLHFQQDTTPCQIRAKRGFATHPRSIAERVRRTRISEKMRKLQDLFPTMDKQTSTADMLDSAVEFIKELQKQVQTLTDIKGKCICSNKPQ
ncbi:hypothetical protein ABFX02_02G123600 [Erythranthe guttata]